MNAVRWRLIAVVLLGLAGVTGHVALLFTMIGWMP